MLNWTYHGLRFALGACLALGLAMAMAPSSHANTPDGDTPSEESVCDDETNDAAGGLCVAYCEAMDCDSDNPMASDTACERVAARYETATGQQPPCMDVVVCPCRETWTTAPGAPDITTITLDPAQCFEGTVVSDLTATTTDNLNEYFLFIETSRIACGDGETEQTPDRDVIGIEITEQEIQACKQLLNDRGCAY